MSKYAELLTCGGPQTKQSEGIELLCPNCRKSLVIADDECPTCAFTMREVDGILRALPPDRQTHFHQFVKDYEAVRSAEGRGSQSPDYYFALPFTDVSGRNAWQWKIRAQTWRFIEGRILAGLEQKHPNGLDVLDIGAGNGWMSYRLASHGHRPVAVDLLDNELDGLRAAKHYFSRLPRPFPRFQCEMDCLPFAAKQYDLVVFNASFHYSTDYLRTLTESFRCLRQDGSLIIADSPFYFRDESGRRMIEEKHLGFEKECGRRSDSIPSREYLTPEMLKELGSRLGLTWTTHRPWYGWSWSMRPVKAWLRRRREPSKFYVLCAEVRKP